MYPGLPLGVRISASVERPAPSFTVLTDAQGNRLCVCTPEGRDDGAGLAGLPVDVEVQPVRRRGGGALEPDRGAAAVGVGQRVLTHLAVAQDGRPQRPDRVDVVGVDGDLDGVAALRDRGGVGGERGHPPGQLEVGGADPTPGAVRGGGDEHRVVAPVDVGVVVELLGDVADRRHEVERSTGGRAAERRAQRPGQRAPVGQLGERGEHLLGGQRRAVDGHAR